MSGRDRGRKRPPVNEDYDDDDDDFEPPPPAAGPSKLKDKTKKPAADVYDDMDTDEPAADQASASANVTTENGAEIGEEDDELGADGATTRSNAPGPDVEVDQGEMAVVEDLLNLELPPPVEFIQNADGTGERLMITKIVCENFKSYHGEHTLGPFHKNFTAIVGPNGSGKSNVIDSLLFVFGFRAKKLRGDNVAALVHKSTNHKPNHCSVAIHFQKIIDVSNEEYTVVEDSQFNVKRRIVAVQNMRTKELDPKNVDSKYTINSKNRNLKEVAKYLNDRGIDLDHNRFLILQGEVEQISLMKPKAENENDDGMLEYLEDIIGSSRFKEPLEKLSNKIDELTELRAEHVKRMRRAEENKNMWEGPKNELVDYLEDKNIEARITNRELQLDRALASQLHVNKQRSFDESEQAVKLNAEQLAVVEEKIKTRDEKIKNLQEAAEAAEKLAVETEDRMKALNQEEKDRKQERSEMKKKLAELVAECTTQTNKLRAAEAKPATADNEIEKLKGQLKKLEAREKEVSAVLTERLDEVSTRTQPMQEQLKQVEQQLGTFKADMDQAKAQKKLADNKLVQFTEAHNKEKRLLQEMNVNLQNLDDEQLKTNRTIDDCSNLINRKQMEVDHSRACVQALEQELPPKRDKLATMQATISRVTQQQQDNNLKGKKARLIKEAMDSGTIKGIRGRLGDLGFIDAKYDVAVSTAVPRLDDIVCETTKCAQEVVAMLAPHNVGRTTCIMLDKVNANENFIRGMRPLQNIPQNVPRLFDLIKVRDDKDEVRAAFYCTMRDTLVAENMHQGRQVSFGGQRRHRVVTLDGDMLETTGQMSGGGAPKKGQMGSSVQAPKETMSPEAQQNLQREINSLREQVEAGNKEQNKHQGQITVGEQEIARAKETLAKEEKKKQHNAASKRLAEEQLVRQQQLVDESQVDEAKQTQLQADVETAQRAVDEQTERAKTVKTEAKRIKDEIEKINQELVGKIQDDQKRVTKEREDTEKLIEKEKSTKNASLLAVEKCNDRLAAIAVEQEELTKKRAELATQIEAMEEPMMQLIQARADANTNVEKAREAHTAAKAESRACDDQEKELRKEKMQLEQDLEEKRAELKQSTHRIEQFNKKLEALELKDLRAFRVKRRVFRTAAGADRSAPSTSSSAQNMDISMDTDEREEEEEVEISEALRYLKGLHVLDEDGTVNSDKLIVYEQEDMAELLGDKAKYDRHMEQLSLEKDKVVYRASKRKVDKTAIEQFQKREKKYLECIAQMDEVTERRNLHKAKHDDFKKKRLNEFFTGYRLISEHLKEMYQTITIGGDAELTLVDSCDPFSEGIEFTVRPPRKSWKAISLLSGGEKTLSSLALVFALHHFRPTPLYVMDEIDAALDFKNVSIIANYIEERTKNAQFIIISLRNNMFELGNRLIGIYKTEDCTKHVVIDPALVAQQVQQHALQLQQAQAAVAQSV